MCVGTGESESDREAVSEFKDAPLRYLTQLVGANYYQSLYQWKLFH